MDEQTLHDIENQKVKAAEDLPTTMLEEDEPTELTSDHVEEPLDGITVTAVTNTTPPQQRRKRRFFGATSVSTEDPSEIAAVSTGEVDGSAQGRVRRSALATIRARATGYRPQAPLQPEDDEHDPNLHLTARDTQLTVVEENDDNNNDEMQSQRRRRILAEKWRPK